MRDGKNDRRSEEGSKKREAEWDFTSNGHPDSMTNERPQGKMKEIVPETGDVDGDPEEDVREVEGVSEVDAGDSGGEPESNKKGGCGDQGRCPTA